MRIGRWETVFPASLWLPWTVRHRASAREAGECSPQSPVVLQTCHVTRCRASAGEAGEQSPQSPMCFQRRVAFEPETLSGPGEGTEFYSGGVLSEFTAVTTWVVAGWGW
ncbi:hypothetical protein NDU88_005881 [Pleurodeles waltl]|uniref:Secreted protein n=1 Tax=Pleurodeles waltl TaxID=8319 RepID=A0AAV7RNQ3_PLEWA|nr:hypothetical protein NDU88_005881 [Pleurodeles waltl]